MSTVLRGARVTLRHGVEVVGLRPIVSLAAADNHASHAVMRRVGRTQRGGFDLPRRHLLCAHNAARAGKDQP